MYRQPSVRISESEADHHLELLKSADTFHLLNEVVRDIELAECLARHFLHATHERAPTDRQPIAVTTTMMMMIMMMMMKFDE